MKFFSRKRMRLNDIFIQPHRETVLPDYRLLRLYSKKQQDGIKPSAKKV
jgi:hypothetical protein